MERCPSAEGPGWTGKRPGSPGPLSRAAALCGEPNCPGLHQDPSVGPAMGQGHVANGIWNLGDLMRKQALGEKGLTLYIPREQREAWVSDPEERSES